MFEPDKITRSGGASNGSAQKDTALRAPSKALIRRGKMWVIARRWGPPSHQEVRSRHRRLAQQRSGRKIMDLGSAGCCNTALRALAAASLTALPLAAASPALAALEAGPCGVEKQADVPATMRNGTVLLADVYRPREPGTY